jgi:hypothetical protein
VLDIDQACEERGDFVRAENNRQPLGLLAERDAVQNIFLPERDLIEKTQCAEGLVVNTPGDLLLLNEVEEVGSGVVTAEVLGRPPEVSGEEANARDVGIDGPSGVMMCSRVDVKGGAFMMALS